MLTFTATAVTVAGYGKGRRGKMRMKCSSPTSYSSWKSTWMRTLCRTTSEITCWVRVSLVSCVKRSADLSCKCTTKAIKYSSSSPLCSMSQMLPLISYDYACLRSNFNERNDFCNILLHGFFFIWSDSLVVGWMLKNDDYLIQIVWVCWKNSKKNTNH